MIINVYSIKHFERKDSTPLFIVRIKSTLLDMCSHSDFMEIAHNKGMTLAEKVKRLEEQYI